MKRLATLVGCNYPNCPELKLQGCINDVHAMKTLLMSRFGFAESDIRLLTDEPDSPSKPTTANIMQALNKMIDQAEDSDVLFFHFSGHGFRTATPNDPGKFDVDIVACDKNHITAVDIGKLMDRVPSGATFTFLADSDYSGGLLDKQQAILLSACKANENAEERNVEGRIFREFGYAVRKALESNKSPLTNIKLVTLAGTIIHGDGYTQQPCLFCSQTNADATFLLQPPEA